MKTKTLIPTLLTLTLLLTLLPAVLFTATAVSSGANIDLSDTNPPSNGTGWTFSSTNHVYTILDGANVTVTGSAGTETNQRRLLVAAGATANITLNGATMPASDSQGKPGIRLNDGANLTLTIIGTNVLRGGEGIRCPAGTTLTIKGTGSLSALPGINNLTQGIGNGNNPVGTIIIESGTVTATGSNGSTSNGAAGIAGSTITIKGGTVTATGGGGVAGGNGGAGISGTVVIDGGTVTAVRGAAATGTSAISGTVTVNGPYDYWTNADRTDPGGSPTRQTFDNDTATFAASNNFGYIKLREAVPRIDLADTSPPSSGLGWTFASNVYTILNGANVTVTGTSEGSWRRLAVAANATAAITLDDATIKLSGGSTSSPLLLNNGANLTLTLVGENTFSADNARDSRAGIEAPDGTELTINGTGSLTAQGGYGGEGGNGGAGIGGGYLGDGGTITINSGTVTAIGGDFGAGIGGGRRGAGGTVTINGGNVTASTNSSTGIARAIGRGAGGSNGTVTVNGTYDYWTNTANTDPGGTPTRQTFSNDTATFANSQEFRYIKLVSALIYVNGAEVEAPTVARIQSAISEQLNDDDVTEVTVTGRFTSATSMLTIDIPEGKKVLWDAEYSGSTNGVTIRARGEGEIVLGENAELTNNYATGPLFQVTGNAKATINGANLTALGGYALYLSTNATATINSGTLTNTLADPAGQATVWVTAYAALAVHGGTITNTEPTGRVVFAAGYASVYVTGGTIDSGKIQAYDNSIRGYYMGDNAGKFGSGFTNATNLFQLDTYLMRTIENGAFQYTGALYEGVVNAAFAPGLELTAVTVNPPTALHTFSGNIVTFAGTYDTTVQSIAITGTLGSGKIPVTFTNNTAFGLNLNSIYYTITATAGANGSVTGGGSYPRGWNLTLTATPDNGYKFEGWYENNVRIDSANAVYSFMVIENRTLQARFTEASYNITYNLDGGTGDTTGSYTFGAGLDTLPTPTKPGYTFGGWFDNADLGGAPVTEITAADYGNKELWAKWEPEVFYVNDTPVQDPIVDSIRDAINNALAESDTVTVTGRYTTAYGPLKIEIPADKTLVWDAEYSGYFSGILIDVSGAGSMILDNNAVLSNISAVYAYDTVKLVIDGGTIKSSHLAIMLYDDSALVVLDGSVTGYIDAYDDSVVYVAGGVLDDSAIAVPDSGAQTCYYTGDNAAKFHSSFPPQRLFKLDAAPALTTADGDYTYNPDLPHSGSPITATFASGLEITSVTVNPETALHEFADNKVVFAGVYNEEITLEVAGTLAGGRIPVEFATAEFGVNIDCCVVCFAATAACECVKCLECGRPEAACGVIEIKSVKYPRCLTTLDLSYMGLTDADIEPLQYMTNLTKLYLMNNDISDISVLSSLDSLEVLDLYDNNISDISPLTNLTNLGELYLERNNISDISALAGLTELSDLALNNNNISDISVLSSLVNLKSLALSRNNISDVSTLSSLTDLLGLYLDGNPLTLAQIDALETALPSCIILHDAVEGCEACGRHENFCDCITIKNVKYPLTATVLNLPTMGLTNSNIEPLVHMTNLMELNLSNNNISDISVLSSLTNLEYLYLLNNNISDISALAGLTGLRELNLDNNNIGDFSVLGNLTNLTLLALSNTNISDISMLSSLTKLTNLGLYDNPLTLAQIDELQAELPSCTIRHNAVAGCELCEKHLTLCDCITIKDVKIARSWTVLFLDEMELTNADIEPLVHMTNLTVLVLESNNISDISVLASLTGLEELNLDNNDISDLTPLYSLTQLSWLALRDNPITGQQVDALQKVLPDCVIYTNAEYEFCSGCGERIDECVIIKGVHYYTGASHLDLSFMELTNEDIEPLIHMTDLIELDLYGNDISDISVLAGLTDLRWLYLDNNNISDISPLTSLTNLQSLLLNFNNISDISPLSSLTNLAILNLTGNNNISDVSPLTSLTNLTELYLTDNNISDVSALSGLTNLIDLDLDYNNISDVSPLTSLTNLTKLYLNDNNISDVSALSSLTNLTDLYLDNNNISDVSPLTSLTSLELLGLFNNPLTYAQITALEAALPDCDIVHSANPDCHDLDPDDCTFCRVCERVLPRSCPRDNPCERHVVVPPTGLGDVRGFAGVAVVMVGVFAGLWGYSRRRKN